MKKDIRTAAALVLAALAAAVVAHASLGSSRSTLSGVKAATAKFKSLAVAQHGGYGLLRDKDGIACIAMDPMPGMNMAMHSSGPMRVVDPNAEAQTGAMGVHYVNSKLVGDGALQPTTPEAVVYQPVAGKLKLAALEYVVLQGAWDASHSSPPSLFGHSFNLTAAGNRFGLPAFYSLHVWLFKHNPSGEFSMWNPLVSCKGVK